MRYFMILSALLFTVTLSGCAKDRVDMKSPCVGLDDSPCGPKRNVNDGWLT